MFEIKVKEPEALETSAIEALVRRITAGPQLSGSPKLREFFLYVMDCYLRQTPEEATEQHIGIHVFGRRPGFNSSDDSIVRSQARLLRMKLAVYFANEGSTEPMIIEIPKGHYLPILRQRNEDSAIQPAPVASSGAENPSEEEQDSHGRLKLANSLPGRHFDGGGFSFQRLLPGIVSVVLLLLGFAAGRLTERRISTQPISALDQFWTPFLSAGSSTLVIYSNPIFHGTPSTGLRLQDGDSSDSSPIDDTYTGTGEAAAIYELTRLFDSRKASLTLKRSRLVTWDEAKSSNLIFVGASSQNTALQDLPTATEFTIAMDEKQHGYFVNKHLRPGEPARLPSPDSTQETALIAVLPGLEPSKRIVVLSGLTTIGTAAAVEYACRPQNAAKLLELSGSSNGAINPFEALLRVSISKGVGVGAQLLFLHSR